MQAKIADALGTSPNGLHVSSLGSIVGIDPGKLSRILRMLASRHIFTEGGSCSVGLLLSLLNLFFKVNDNVFCNNRLSILLLSENNVSSLVHMNTTLAPKAAAAFHNNITQPETRFSNETNRLAFHCPLPINLYVFRPLALHSYNQSEVRGLRAASMTGFK